MPATLKRLVNPALNGPVSGSEASCLTDAALGALIRKAWEDCQVAVGSGDKDALREIHLAAKGHEQEVRYADLRKDYSQLKRYFPEPRLLDPARITPKLIPVRSRSLEGRLFRIARGYWSMPFSKGYGRRLRFIVMDEHHEAVIGVLGLQSPSADLACRDDYLGIEKPNKLAIVNNTMDAFTIGAMPSYAPLLGGKLVAGLIHSTSVKQAYWRTYGAARTSQRGVKIHQPLLAVTTTSAFGRSSIYNRLTFGSSALAKRIGYTRGFGTLHLEAIYPHIVTWLKARGRHVPAGFGNGPRVRWQNVMRALCDLGISRQYLAHGIQREVFLFEFVSNLQDVARTNATPAPVDFDDEAWTSFWKERWCLPRASRNPLWANFSSEDSMVSALSPKSP